MFYVPIIGVGKVYGDTTITRECIETFIYDDDKSDHYISVFYIGEVLSDMKLMVVNDVLVAAITYYKPELERSLGGFHKYIHVNLMAKNVPMTLRDPMVQTYPMYSIDNEESWESFQRISPVLLNYE